MRRFLFWALVGPLVLAALAVGGFVGYVVYLSWQTPSIDDLEARAEATNSAVYAADGTRLGFIRSENLRQDVSGRLIPQLLKDATVAIEDRRYWEHTGVDYTAILRAAAEDVAAQAPVQGGSTITMQLVRNLYLHRERTFKRKIEEATLAREMEKRRSKDEILDEYLNVVPYGTLGGQTAYGVQAAARLFFGRPARSLTLPQIALVAGLPRAPSLYNPVRFPERARERRSQVLDAMVDLGMISSSRAADADASPLGVRPSRFFQNRRERHFFDYVERELRARLGDEVVDAGGLRVETTLDMKLQRQARKAIRAHLGRPGDPASAVVSIDARNGHIEAMAISDRYERTQFDYASQGKRQPGSTFKPVVLLAAIEGEEADPRRTFYVSKPIDERTAYGRVRVRTFDNTYGGRMNLERAMLRSDNSVYQQLDLDIGPDLVADTAAQMGIESELDALPAEGLGGLTEGVSPLELTRAYATLAARGERFEITGLARVRRADGSVDHLGRPASDQPFREAEVYEVTRILRQNMRRGTGQAAQIGCPAAGKTGTTQNFRDAWFAGYTPRLATVVWVGYPRRSRPMTNVHGLRVTGSNIPSFIWRDYMRVAKGRFCGDFERPQRRPDLRPFCGTRTVTRSCDEPLEPAPPPEEPVAAPFETLIESGPDPTTAERDARFSFLAEGPAVGFECSLDDGGYEPCSSPLRYRDLDEGAHTFAVRAVGDAGRPDTTPATWSWTVIAERTRRRPRIEPESERERRREERRQREEDTDDGELIG